MDNHERDGFRGGEIATDLVPSLMGFSIDREWNSPFRRECRRLIVGLAIAEER